MQASMVSQRICSRIQGGLENLIIIGTFDWKPCGQRVAVVDVVNVVELEICWGSKRRRRNCNGEQSRESERARKSCNGWITGRKRSCRRGARRIDVRIDGRIVWRIAVNIAGRIAWRIAWRIAGRIATKAARRTGRGAGDDLGSNVT